jgi:hypothetical protein
MKTSNHRERRSVTPSPSRWLLLAWLLGLVPSTGQGQAYTDADLRQAMANGGRVALAFDGTIALTNAITVGLDTTLDASGHSVTICSQNSLRLFGIPTNVTLTLINLALTGGWSTNGGALYIAGGTVNATNCVFSDNDAEASDGTSVAWGGGDGDGGAIYNAGNVNASQCAFQWNGAQGGKAWASNYGAGGGAGRGGAIYNAGSMVLDRSLLWNNRVGGGAGGQGTSGETLFGPGAGGAGGSAIGTAICNLGTGALVNCTLAWNFGSGGQGGDGGPLGGAPYLTPGAPGGMGGSGGAAVANLNGLLALTNCTLAFNTGTGGGGGSGTMGFMGGSTGAGGDGGDAVGGIRNTGTLSVANTGTVLLVNCVLASNSGAGGQGGSGRGSSPNGTAGGAAGNLEGAFTDSGHNLSSDASTQLTGPGSMVGTDPNLGPLTDNGGPAWTMALLPSSPAINAADTASAPPVDQRDFPRPVGPAADIGAYEYGSPAILVIAQAGPLGLDLLAYGVSGEWVRLLASSDLSNWTPVSTNQFGSDGTFQFFQATNQSRAFFHLQLQ